MGGIRATRVRRGGGGSTNACRWRAGGKPAIVRGMCGRTMLTSPVSALQRIFGVPERPNLMPRWNIAPTQEIAVVRLSEDGAGWSLALPRWGLVPGWARAMPTGAPLVNARSESAAEKPAFRDALRARRCLIPVDGFYEWTDAGGRKQGHIIRRRDRALFALAGLWERWRGPADGLPQGTPLDRTGLDSAAVLTTAANATLSPLHHRMPVVLDPADWAAWLAPDTPLADIVALMRPAPDSWFDHTAVGPRVNAVIHDDPSCLDSPDAGSTAPPDRKADHAQLSLF